MDEMIEQSYGGYKLHIHKDKFELSTNVSNFIENQIVQTLKIKDRFQFCVSGGSTPKSVYQLLSERDIEWEKVDIFLGDERCVDPKSELNSSPIKSTTAVPVVVNVPTFDDIDKPSRVTVSSARFPHSPSFHAFAPQPVASN